MEKVLDMRKRGSPGSREKHTERGLAKRCPTTRIVCCKYVLRRKRIRRKKKKRKKKARAAPPCRAAPHRPVMVVVVMAGQTRKPKVSPSPLATATVQTPNSPGAKGERRVRQPTHPASRSRAAEGRAEPKPGQVRSANERRSRHKPGKHSPAHDAAAPPANHSAGTTNRPIRTSASHLNFSFSHNPPIYTLIPLYPESAPGRPIQYLSIPEQG